MPRIASLLDRLCDLRLVEGGGDAHGDAVGIAHRHADGDGCAGMTVGASGVGRRAVSAGVNPNRRAELIVV